MKTKYLYVSIILLFILIFLQPKLLIASSAKMQNEFKIYKIGAEDTLSTATEKLVANGFQCASGKATHLGINSAQEDKKNQTSSEYIDLTKEMDNKLKDYGEGLAYNEMMIDTIDCQSKEEGPIEYSSYFFSNFNQKILLIEIKVKKFETVKGKLASKYGPCILKGYCESEDSILILPQKGGWHILVYFFENLKPHYEKIKKEMEAKEKMNLKKINEAF